MELNQYLQKRQRTTEQRGAAVLIVALAIMLLSGLGAWAMQSAALVDQASGYSRQALQTQYVAELGVTAGTTFLSVPGWGAAQYNSGINKPDACESTRGQATTRFCRSLYMTDVDKGMTRPTIDPGTTTAVGSMGTFNTGDGAMQGTYTVEMTDPERTIVPGSDISKSQYYRVTLSSRGQVRPVIGIQSGETDACRAGPNSIAGRIGLRAHTVVGPI